MPGYVEPYCRQFNSFVIFLLKNMFKECSGASLLTSKCAEIGTGASKLVNKRTLNLRIAYREKMEMKDLTLSC